MKFKDFILVMKNMIFTEEEAMNVVELLKEKSNAMQEILQKVTGVLRLALLLHLLTIYLHFLSLDNRSEHFLRKPLKSSKYK